MRLLSRLSVLSAVLVFLTASRANADTVVDFDASGTLVDGRTFSGTVDIDETSVTVTAADLTLSSGEVFNSFVLGGDFSTFFDAEIATSTGPFAELLLFVPAAAPPVPYTGGSICSTTYLPSACDTPPSDGLPSFVEFDVAPGSDVYVNVQSGTLVEAAPTAPPVPEPASFVLLGTGLAGALGVARRRLHKGLPNGC